MNPGSKTLKLTRKTRHRPGSQRLRANNANRLSKTRYRQGSLMGKNRSEPLVLRLLQRRNSLSTSISQKILEVQGKAGLATRTLGRAYTQKRKKTTVSTQRGRERGEGDTPSSASIKCHRKRFIRKDNKLGARKGRNWGRSPPGGPLPKWNKAEERAAGSGYTKKGRETRTRWLGIHFFPSRGGRAQKGPMELMDSSKFEEADAKQTPAPISKQQVICTRYRPAFLRSETRYSFTRHHLRP